MRDGLRIKAKNYEYAEIKPSEPNTLVLDYDYYGDYYGRHYNVKFIVLKDKVKVEKCILEYANGIMHGGDIDILLDEFNEVLRILQEDFESNDVVTICGDVKGIITRYL
jgi:hypothetical protein